MYNHLLFRDNIHSKYSAFYQPSGNIIYEGLTRITDSDIHAYSYEIEQSNLIGINEIMLSETINRPLKEIYDLQLKMLEMLKVKFTNSYPLQGIPLLLR